MKFKKKLAVILFTIICISGIGSFTCTSRKDGSGENSAVSDQTVSGGESYDTADQDNGEKITVDEIPEYSGSPYIL